MLIARFASSWATFWGVHTTTAPVSGSSWLMVSGTSPVPGGRSMIKKSSSPQSVCVASC